MLKTSIKEAHMTNRIVAAIDSSPASRAAMEWAFGEASRTGEDLLAVHVVEHTRRWDPSQSRDTAIAAGAATAQRRVLTAVSGASDVESPVRVTISAHGGSLVSTLARAAREAGMVVMGEPQSPEHAGLPEKVAAACACDVVAVSENHDVRLVSAASADTPPDRTSS
jgi:nucleotide-binding universal stress UspA family protein